MKERPILFSAPMVRALLADTKTQTRRIVKHPHAAEVDVWADEGNGRWGMGVQEAGVSARMDAMLCPYGQPGARLWVRETWRLSSCGRHYPTQKTTAYVEWKDRQSTDRQHQQEWACSDSESEALLEKQRVGTWRPSIHMPRWASRIDLEVAGVRVERLQAISDADAIAEGIERVRGRDVPAAMGGNVQMWRDYLNPDGWQATPAGSYRTLWESINGPGSWAENPWVWVVEFKRVAP